MKKEFTTVDEFWKHVETLDFEDQLRLMIRTAHDRENAKFFWDVSRDRRFLAFSLEHKEILIDDKDGMFVRVYREVQAELNKTVDKQP